MIERQALLLLEQCLQPSFLWLLLPRLAWTTILPISASQVARFMGVSHQHPAKNIKYVNINL
jgi:hypothetical protein